jgi:uncharacterized protein YbjT (DUF2867 family)
MVSNNGPRGREEEAMSTETIVVTGASGNVGRAVTARLLDAGREPRVLARRTEGLAGAIARGAQPRLGSLGDRAFVAQALAGADAAFVMIPPDYAAADPLASQRAQIEAVVAAVHESGLRKVVALSSIGAELASGNGPIQTVHVLEERLGAVPGLDVVFLRPTYFMENFLSAIGLIKSAGINGGAMRADVPLPMIATVDIAAAAAELLLKPDFQGTSVRTLLGPRDYTQAEATRILGSAVGRPDLAYVGFPYDDARKGMVGAGLQPALADLYVEMADAFNHGRIPTPPRSAASTTPTTLEEFAKSVFAPAFGA